MADPFVSYINVELPRRSIMYTSLFLAYDGDPNSGLAPADLAACPIGAFYLQDTGGVLWRKTAAVAPNSWVNVAGGGSGVDVNAVHQNEAGLQHLIGNLTFSGSGPKTLSSSSVTGANADYLYIRTATGADGLAGVDPGNGGSIWLYPGSSGFSVDTSTGQGGNLFMICGNGSASGGTIAAYGGAGFDSNGSAPGGAGGSVSFVAGGAGIGSGLQPGGNGGRLNFESGPGEIAGSIDFLVAQGAISGNISLTSGYSYTSSAGGDVQITAGASNAGAGGNVTLSGGAGAPHGNVLVSGALKVDSELVPRWLGVKATEPVVRKEGDVYYNSVTTDFWQYANAAWRPLGAGGGGADPNAIHQNVATVQNLIGDLALGGTGARTIAISGVEAPGLQGRYLYLTAGTGGPDDGLFSGQGGNAVFSSGAGGSSVTPGVQGGFGGTLRFSGGAPGASPAGTPHSGGGDIVLAAGDGAGFDGASGGSYTARAGGGGASSGLFAPGSGGTITFEAGNGADDSLATFSGGSGGSVAFAAGNGGLGLTSGAGGDISFYAGGGTPSGNIVLAAAASPGHASDGIIRMQGDMLLETRLNDPGAHHNITGKQAGAPGLPGQALTIAAARGGDGTGIAAPGAGGPLSFTAGNSGTRNLFGSAAGGAVNITAGASTGGLTGGNVILRGGVSDTGIGGSVFLEGGTGVTPGSIKLDGPIALTDTSILASTWPTQQIQTVARTTPASNGLGLRLSVGDGSAGDVVHQPGVGGDLQIYAGSAGILGGNAAGSSGGGVYINCGTSSDLAPGASFALTAGYGGTGSATVPAGDGGQLYITAGDAGTADVGGGAIGGSVRIQAGSGTGIAASGNIELTPGFGSTPENYGDVLVGEDQVVAASKFAHAGYTLSTSDALIRYEPVYISGTNYIGKASATSGTAATVVGFSAKTYANSASRPRVIHTGILPGVLTGATRRDPVYLAVGGGFTLTAPSGAGNVVRRLGWALSSTDMLIDIADSVPPSTALSAANLDIGPLRVGSGGMTVLSPVRWGVGDGEFYGMVVATASNSTDVQVVGFALASGAAGAMLPIRKQGLLVNALVGLGLNSGSVVYLSTSGWFTGTAPSNPGEYVRRLGYAIKQDGSLSSAPDLLIDIGEAALVV